MNFKWGYVSEKSHCATFFINVSIVTGCGLKKRGSIPGMGKDFSLCHTSRPAVATQPHIQWAISPGLKWAEREAEYSPQSSAEVYSWSYTGIPPYLFMV
jgi:hypothetical protein